MRVLIQFLRATSAHSPNAESPKFAYEAAVFVWSFKLNCFVKRASKAYIQMSELPLNVLEAIKAQGAKSGNTFVYKASNEQAAIVLSPGEAYELLAKRPHILRKNSESLEVKTA